MNLTIPSFYTYEILDFKTEFMKMSVLTKINYSFNTTPNKIPADLWGVVAECGKLILQFIWKYRELGLAAKIFLKQNKKGGLALPDTKYFKYCN